MSSGVTRVSSLHDGHRPRSGSSFGPLAAWRVAASAAESPVAAKPGCASTSSAEWLCQALLGGGCAAPAGAAGAGVDGGAAGTAGEGFGAAGAEPGGGAPGAAVDAFAPAVSDVEAEAGPAFGAGVPVSLCSGLGSLTCLGWDSPADL